MGLASAELGAGQGALFWSRPHVPAPRGSGEGPPGAADPQSSASHGDIATRTSRRPPQPEGGGAPDPAAARAHTRARGGASDRRVCHDSRLRPASPCRGDEPRPLSVTPSAGRAGLARAALPRRAVPKPGSTPHACRSTARTGAGQRRQRRTHAHTWTRAAHARAHAHVCSWKVFPVKRPFVTWGKHDTRTERGVPCRIIPERTWESGRRLVTCGAQGVRAQPPPHSDQSGAEHGAARVRPVSPS